MSVETFLALVLFAFTTSVTPGPNNAMLFASGVNFGFRRTVPHMFGIGIGFFSLLIGTGFGLGALIHAVPALELVLKLLGGAYLLYIAWKIGSAQSLGEVEARGQPMSFLAAAAFQWVNPKAWMMAVTAMSAYTVPEAYVASVLAIGTVFALVNLPSVSLWAGFGAALRGWLSHPLRFRIFSVSMALLLVVSLWPMLR